MIVIPMLGRSSRFFDAGYAIPKYQLPLGHETVFARAVRSFERQFASHEFVFLVRADHDAAAFVAREVTRLGIRRFRVQAFRHETRGQAESVRLGTADGDPDSPLVIFNIDTVRHGFEWPDAERFGDGFLEVFRAEGDGWSFVEPGSGDSVVRTTEKQRISDLCSNGLYGFARLQDFRDAFDASVAAGAHVRGEYYVAPLYNHLIARGRQVRYHLVDAACIEHCGVPADYERLVASARAAA
jgi:hypothetical protein